MAAVRFPCLNLKQRRQVADLAGIGEVKGGQVPTVRRLRVAEAAAEALLKKEQVARLARHQCVLQPKRHDAKFTCCTRRFLGKNADA